MKVRHRVRENLIAVERVREERKQEREVRDNIWYLFFKKMRLAE